MPKVFQIHLFTYCDMFIEFTGWAFLIWNSENTKMLTNLTLPSFIDPGTFEG